MASDGGSEGLRIVACGPERAGDVHRLTQLAFAPHAALDPPSGAGKETVERVRENLAAGGGAIAELDGELVGCLRWFVDGCELRVRRLAVVPSRQRRGIGRALMAWAEAEARRRGHGAVAVGVRVGLPGNLAFYRGLGYEVIGEHRHDGYERTTWLRLRKRLGER